MEDDKSKKEVKTNMPAKERRPESLLSAPVVIVLIFACVIGLFGSFHYSNQLTTDETTHESRTVVKHGDLKEATEAVDGFSKDEHRQHSGYSAITKPSTTLSTENKNVDYFEERKTLTSADEDTMNRLDEKENPTILLTQTLGLNTLMYQDRDKLTEKEILHAVDSKTDKKDVSLATDNKLETMKAGMEKSEESISHPSVANTILQSSIRTDSTHNQKQIVQDEDEAKLKILPRRNGIKVGHVQNLELEPGKFYVVITRSLDPPIFEIPSFLAKHECQRLIDQATKLGLEKSRYKQPDVSGEPTNQDTFKGWDYDDDNVITPQEVADTLQDTAYLFFTTADIEKMFVDLDIDQNGNGAMDLDEYLRVTNKEIVRYLQNVSQTLPRTMHRNSNHTWLHYNDVEGLNQRVSSLTKLPVKIVERSEKLQVVNYGPEGHYYCHIDSEDIEDALPCCIANDRRTCRLCRYITVLYYLNDVEEGGETAFPVADNVTFSQEEWFINMKYH